MNIKLLSFLCAALAAVLSACAPVNSTVATDQPIAGTDTDKTVDVTEAPLILDPTLLPPVTETPMAFEPAPPASITEPPAQEIPLMFTSLEGQANLNGYELFDGGIKVGDTLSTDANSFVQVFAPGDDRVSFEVKPGSVVQVEAATSDTIRLFLDKGSVRTSVKDGSGMRVVIVSKAGESEAGGTTWISEVDETGALLVAVLEGRVIARAPGGYEVAVNEREKLEISADGVPGWPESTVFIFFYSSLGDTDSGADDGHDKSLPPTLTGRYSRMASELISAGYFIEDSVSPQPLGSYDVLIIINAAYGLTDENIAAIQDWVKSGKGLFYVVDSVTGFFSDPGNVLLGPYGITLTYSEAHGRDQVAGIIPGHPITDGSASLPLYNYCQWYGGIPLAVTSYGEVVMTVSENNGRVLVLCDTDSFANIAWENHPEYDQSKIILNAIQWLAGAD